jgi:hypothetical protein
VAKDRPKVLAPPEPAAGASNLSDWDDDDSPPKPATAHAKATPEPKESAPKSSVPKSVPPVNLGARLNSATPPVPSAAGSVADNLEFLEDLLGDTASDLTGPKTARSGLGDIITPRTQAVVDGKMSPRSAFASPPAAAGEALKQKNAALFGPRSAPSSARSSAPGSARGPRSPPLPPPIETEEVEPPTKEAAPAADEKDDAEKKRLAADMGFDVDAMVDAALDDWDMDSP